MNVELDSDQIQIQQTIVEILWKLMQVHEEVNKLIGFPIEDIKQEP